MRGHQQTTGHNVWLLFFLYRLLGGKINEGHSGSLMLNKVLVSGTPIKLWVCFSSLQAAGSQLNENTGCHHKGSAVQHIWCNGLWWMCAICWCLLLGWRVCLSGGHILRYKLLWWRGNFLYLTNKQISLNKQWTNDISSGICTILTLASILLHHCHTAGQKDS